MQLLEGGGLHTSITSAATGDFSGLNSADAMMFRKLHARMGSSRTDRHRLKAFSEISDIGDRIGVPSSVKDAANVLYVDVDKANKTRGRKMRVLAAGVLFVALRNEGVPRSFGVRPTVSLIRGFLDSPNYTFAPCS
jgi:transcription initiation factor TFIIIB Brf1 subunit/transcription initiation factor TFIIB